MYKNKSGFIFTSPIWKGKGLILTYLLKDKESIDQVLKSWKQSEKKDGQEINVEWPTHLVARNV